MLVLLVRGCGSEGRGLPGELVTEVFPRVVKRVLTSSDDTAILQVGREDTRLLSVQSQPIPSIVTVLHIYICIYCILSYWVWLGFACTMWDHTCLYIRVVVTLTMLYRIHAVDVHCRR